jgi:hypothetical protein
LECGALAAFFSAASHSKNATSFFLPPAKESGDRAALKIRGSNGPRTSLDGLQDLLLHLRAEAFFLCRAGFVSSIWAAAPNLS